MAQNEGNSLGGRMIRHARIGLDVGSAAARIAGGRVFGQGDLAGEGRLIAEALGGLKGPLMKVAQFLATIPDAIPAEWAEEMQKLQAHAPAMGRAFVSRRLVAELGPNWRERFASFELEPTHAASLGQVHRAVGPDGRALAVKLQYPDMASAVEADLSQLSVLFSLMRRLRPQIDTAEIAQEIGERIREELDYEHERRNMRLYRAIHADDPEVRVPDPVEDLSTGRLLTMTWLEGRPLLAYKSAPQEERNRIAAAMFRAWWHPFCRFGVIHGDPHLGNYAVADDDGAVAGINLLDYGCIRVFPPRFVEGVIEHYRGLLTNDRDRVVAAYEAWGFRNLTRELIEALDIWARFLFGPLLTDRTRRIADGVSPIEFGRREAQRVAEALRTLGPVRPPREFPFLDRAAIGLGGVFLHLDAELNFHRLFETAIADFERERLAQRQSAALDAAGLAQPAG
ncbi:AarF/ABC1/UbiB kinase family protein [Siculibacillus lacustris]|uniref:AarF/ABC1/UbiB kinase family protein n=1 Tax=Siculibacillus lacustris TaxID=1549641 RepID=A0A4Q9VKP2_9HYPH|nr:AarF/ABC1/UbiB kinase family protein [Siculibacillus lacustris]TBW35079.1 AarF/ABC1/UbiB kinase family protein [Siculibacillus lacustris]